MPCKRCKDESVVCAASVRKKRDKKAAPRGYVDVLECSQLVLVATIHKLYAMVRNQQKWEYGEPKLNDRSQPVIQDIASKLGCIHPLQDLDLPVRMMIPEDMAGMAGVARQLEQLQKEDKGKGKGHEKHPAKTHSPAQSSSCSEDESEEQDPSAESEASRQSFVGSDIATSSGYRERAFEELEFEEFPFPQDAAITAFSGHVLEAPGYPPVWTTSGASFAGMTSTMGDDACIPDGSLGGTSGFDEGVASTGVGGAEVSNMLPMDMLFDMEDPVPRRR